MGLQHALAAPNHDLWITSYANGELARDHDAGGAGPSNMFFESLMENDKSLTDSITL
jgi:hypothetical protein